MKELLLGIIVGVLICIVGVTNLKGNLSMLKRHHRHRVAEEDKPAMGKIVGTGTLIMGCSIILFGIFSFLSQKLQISVFNIVATSIIIVGFVVGIALIFYGIIKYNKGLF